MHSGAANKVKFFIGRDKMFISKIVPFLTHLQVPAKEYVYKEDEHADEIYFIIDGRAEYVFGEHDTTLKSLS